MADELIDIFDENNKPLEIKKMKSEAHTDGLWHRAAHIWIYNSKGEILLQLRAKDKQFWPDRWDISAAGHVGAGEKPEDAAVRELSEELGISAKAEDLEFVMVKTQDSQFNGLKNKEHDYVYLFRFDGDIKELTMQKEEVQGLRFFGIDELEREISEAPGKYVLHTGRYWREIIKKVKAKAPVR